MPSSPPTQTGIVNAALTRLGSNERLTSINDTGSNSARRALMLWDMVRRALLVRHPWNFAIERHELNAAASGPAFGWTWRYQLPAGCLRWLPPATGAEGWFDGEREGDYILTNAGAPLPVRCITDHDDVTRWSPGFVAAMTECLADWLCLGVTEKTSLTEQMIDRAEAAVRMGKRIDGLETGQRRRNTVVGRSDILRGRSRPYGWRRG